MSPGEKRFDIIRLKRLSHVAIGVRDLERQTEFYVKMWGLEVVERTPQHLYFRAVGCHHHVFELATHHRGLHHVSFEVADDDELDRSVEILRRQSIPIILGPEGGVEPGVGRLLRFRDPERNIIELVSQVSDIEHGYEAKAVKPLSLNHVVLFAGDLREQQTFYEKILGMRLTDAVPNFMTFLRCNPNHHSFGFIALPRRACSTLLSTSRGASSYRRPFFIWVTEGLGGWMDRVVTVRGTYFLRTSKIRKKKISLNCVLRSNKSTRLLTSPGPGTQKAP